MSADVERVARVLCALGGFDPDEIMANDGPRWCYYADSAAAAMAETRRIDAEACDRLAATAQDHSDVPLFAILKHRANWLRARAREATDGTA